MRGALWEATATGARDFPPLDGDLETEVLIVGAGYAGLSTAMALAERGMPAVVVDQHEPGWGASGRNGGIVVPALKRGPDDLIDHLGVERGTRLHRFGGAAPDVVFDLIERFGIDCDPVRSGWLVAAHSPGAAQRLRDRVDEQARHGDPVEFLAPDEMAKAVGSPGYHGGLIDRRGGHVQPLSFARGLANAARALGVRVHGGTEVVGLSRDRGPWKVDTTRGSVTADHVVVATNGYTGPVTPGLQRTLIAVHSLIVATEPLGPTDVLPDDHAVSDSKRVLWYFRKDRDGRLVFGGRGTMKEPAGAESFMRIMNGVRDVFPQLEGIRFEYHWGGRVAVNRPHLPQINRPVPGMTAVMGFNGRGLAFATAIGPAVAAIVAGEDPDEVSPLPVTHMPVIPLHGLQGVMATVGTRWYMLRDRLE